jgi:hypothetical protein
MCIRHIDNDAKRLRNIAKANGLSNDQAMDLIESLNEVNDRFWYYFDTKVEPHSVMGPFSREAMKGFIESGVINACTLVWHPSLNDWRYMSFAKPLFDDRSKVLKDFDGFINELRRDNDIQPVMLKQGYLHMQTKRKKNWKMRWAVMHKDSLQISVVPGAVPKIVIKLENAIVKPELTKEKNDKLTFSITEAGKELGIVFWSPFQKALIEWINELRKLIYITSTIKQSNKIIEQPKCAENETNLIVTLY